MRVKIVLSIGSKLVKGNLIKCVETYRYTGIDGNEEGYDIVVVEGDEIIVDVGGEQYVPLAIENGVVTAWFPYKERESCFSCAQTFEKDSMILAVYGLLFCTTDCVLDKFPDADLNDVEIILPSDIGV
ncbi:MAG: hypothetical protein GX963_15325 [Bacteroidales bacterium]|nr:hypothetical protein [Bacteroidales bacterium]